MESAMNRDFVKEVAQSIYDYVIAEEMQAGEGLPIEADYGLSKDWWIDGRVDVRTHEIFDKGDYLTPDYSAVEYTSINLCPRSSIIDDEGYEMYFDAAEIRDINRELAKLCA